MGKVNESIFSGKKVIIPMADVSHVEKHWHQSDEVKDDTTIKGYNVITRHTTWNEDIDYWNNNIYLTVEEGKKFLSAWCRYRHELESETLAKMP